MAYCFMKMFEVFLGLKYGICHFVSCNVSTVGSFFQSYSMAVYLVKQLSSTMLLQRLRAKGIRNPDHSRALSKQTYSPEESSCCPKRKVAFLSNGFSLKFSLGFYNSSFGFTLL